MESMSENGLLELNGIIRKTNPPPFLLKTYMLVDDVATDDVVSWNDGGTAFVVWQPAEFARDLLPTLFKHSNFSSFVRQLNTYGFKKVATSRWEFSNDKFQRGKKELLGQIRRRKAWSHRQQPPPPPPTVATKGSADHDHHNEDQRSWSTSSSSDELNTLVDENKRLKKENGVLNSELTTMKNKCKELLQLVAIYSTSRRNEDENNDENRLKLFGVRLDVGRVDNNGGEDERKRKRKRSAEIYDTTSLLLSQSCK